MTVQVGDGGGWCRVGLWREGKLWGGRSEVAEGLLMETFWKDGSGQQH